DVLARLLFWASPGVGIIVFWAIVHYIAGFAPIVTGGPQ
ncbi:MAG: hypothetical protein JWO97_3400, partial [Acidobacteria bacterium]|nr:hypothetical protein [Acidobacteriota bacterium]